jgi:hypothetical protein
MTLLLSSADLFFESLKKQKSPAALYVMDRASIFSVVSLNGKRGHQYFD